MSVADVGRPLAGRQLTPKGAATRSRIIETATDLFATDGYAAVTVREVAARTGLSSGAIYASFRGKADLLVEAVRASIAVDLNEVPEEVLGWSLPRMDVFQFTTGDNPRRARLRALLLEAAVAARTDPQVREQLGAMLADRLDEWSTNHRRWQEAAGVDPGLDMRSLTAMLMCIEIGAGVLAAAGVEEPAAEQTAVYVERMLASLVPDTAPDPGAGA